MKNIIISVLSLAVLVACNQKPESFTIEGNLRGELENGTQIFLKKQGDNGQPVTLDTTIIENGNFTFTGVANLPEMHYIFVDKLRGYKGIVLENGRILFSAQKDSLGLAKISGTEQNDVFSSYIDKAQEMSRKGMAIQEDMQIARQSNDNDGVGSLNDEMEEFREEYKNFELDFIKQNPNALISVLLLDKVVSQKIIDDQNEVQEYFDGLGQSIKETSAAKKVADKIEANKVLAEKGKATAIGAKAPEFVAPGIEGGQLALKDMLGKITLVDFWAAWCKPCRAENPNIVAVYEKYHDKGLNVIGVSLDKGADAWKKAVKDDGLTWNHVSNLKYWDEPVAKLYSVTAIPAAFLLDENGVIIAKDLRGGALESKVAELLN